MAGFSNNPFYRIATNPLVPPRPIAPQAPVVNWTGASGIVYGLQLYRIGSQFYENPGVYIFCHVRPNGIWQALYVGETRNFRNRLQIDLANHHAYFRAVRLGATHICAQVIPGPIANRETVETDLRRGLNPPLNDQ